MPKRELDYMKCEVMRYYKLQTKGLVEPISMTVPRKVALAMYCRLVITRILCNMHFYMLWREWKFLLCV